MPPRSLEREAEVTSGGAELGPVGGRIVAEVFVDLLRVDGVANKVQEPNLPDVSGGDFRIGDRWLPPTSPRGKNLGHRLRHRILLRRDRVGTASTSNFTGQMILRSRDRGGTAFTYNFTE